jgi:membrane protease YdiL (CAAX protease family)
MADHTEQRPSQGLSAAIDRFGRSRPDIVLLAPLMTYLLLLGLTQVVPPTWQPAVIVLRGVGSLAVVWLFRRHLPPWGRPHWPIAILGGALVAWGWAAGQAWLDELGVPGRLPLYPGERVIGDPRDTLGAVDLFRATWVLRMLVAVLAVPVVEELFWRAFLLRALIDWHDFERIPLGTFTWFSFLGTSLLSTLQHPDNWVVSVLCWMVFNAVFYWTRSILCLVLLHGMTNLVLYLIVVRVADWSHW